jgi:DsbC/DsbD-like thiol-disulfide interchange protein
MRKYFPVFASLALTFAAVAAEPPKKPGEAASIEKVEVQGDAKAGGNVVAVVHVKLEKNWHVQSNKPSAPNFIPTELKLTPTPGVKVTTIKYPEGKSDKVQGLAKPLSVYEENFQINVLLALDARVKLPLTIPATLSYQACQGANCYPPKRLKVEIPLGEPAKQK